MRKLKQFDESESEEIVEDIETVENELEGTGLEGTIFDDSSKEKGFID